MKPIKLILLIMIISLLITLTGNAQNWQWANKVGGTGWDGGGNILKDGSGNVYAIVSAQGLCNFQTDSFYVNGYNDIFLVKYNSGGTEQWVKQFGGNNTSSHNEGVGGICFDQSGTYIYMTGVFSGSAIFGSTTLTITTSKEALFLAKFDLAGNCIWAKQNSGSVYSIGGGVDVDNAGNVYICGENAITTTLDTVSLQAGGFIAKFDNSGNCIWAKKKFRKIPLVTYCEAAPACMKIYNSNIIIAGSTVNDTIMVDTITALNNGINSIFVASFNLNGDVQWLKLGGGSNGWSGGGVSVDNTGNIYAAGIYSNTAAFGSTVITNTTATFDAFLAKYDINGNFKWVQSTNASIEAMGSDVSSTSDGNTYFSGYFSGTANFGTYNITSSTTKDMFVARYDSIGNCLGVKTFGQANGGGVYASDNNSFCVTGAFNNTVSIGSTNLTSRGSSDAFVAQCGAITGVENRMLSTNNTLTIYANPNKGTCTITVPEDLLKEQNLVLNIYDSNGKLIQQQPVQVEQEKIKINIEAEATGIYNVTLGNSKKMYSGKIVFE